MSESPLPSKLVSLATPSRVACAATSELEAAFPSMEVSHAIRVTGKEEWAVIAALAVCFDAHGARLEQLTCRCVDGARIAVICRVTRISSRDVEAAIRQLAAFDAIDAIHVEHVFARGRC